MCTSLRNIDLWKYDYIARDIPCNNAPTLISIDILEIQSIFFLLEFCISIEFSSFYFAYTASYTPATVFQALYSMRVLFMYKLPRVLLLICNELFSFTKTKYFHENVADRYWFWTLYWKFHQYLKFKLLIYLDYYNKFK